MPHFICTICGNEIHALFQESFMYKCTECGHRKWRAKEPQTDIRKFVFYCGRKAGRTEANRRHDEFVQLLKLK